MYSKSLKCFTKGTFLPKIGLEVKRSTSHYIQSEKLINASLHVHSLQLLLFAVGRQVEAACTVHYILGHMLYNMMYYKTCASFDYSQPVLHF